MTRRSERLAPRLCRLSIRGYRNPYAHFDLDAPADPDRLATSAPLLSLAACPDVALDDRTRHRLALLEAAHVFSLNIAGERELITGLASRLWRDPSPAVSGYVQHFLHEENAHSVVFSAFCLRHAGKIYPDRALRLPRSHLPGEQEFLFWTHALLFEHVALYLNRRQADDDDLWPGARRIHEYHALEEGRHVAFGESFAADLWDRHAPAWGESGRARVGADLLRYLDFVLRQHVSPDVFRDAGVPGDPHDLRDRVLASPQRQRLHDEATARARAFLRKLGATP